MEAMTLGAVQQTLSSCLLIKKSGSTRVRTKVLVVFSRSRHVDLLVNYQLLQVPEKTMAIRRKEMSSH